MAGATLPPSLMTDLHRDFAGGNIPITIHGKKRFETSLPEFVCPHCKFLAGSAAKLTQHRWDVHPLSARLKEHLMPSPKGARKRPNSESSDEAKESESDDVAPKKKLSPAHVMMTTCDFDANCNHVRRTSSADEIMKLKQAEEQTKQKSHSLGDLHTFDHYPTSHTHQENEEGWENHGAIVGHDATATTSDDCNGRVEAAKSSRSEMEGDLHTLARAALTTAPLDWNKKETQSVPTPSNWLTYVGGGVVPNGIPNVTVIPGTFPQVWGHYVPETTTLQSFHPGFFVTQPSFAVAGSFPPGPGFPVSFPVYPPTISVTPPQANKLSTLSDVASRYLAGVDEQGRQVSHGKSDSEVTEKIEKTNPQPIEELPQHNTPHLNGVVSFESQSASPTTSADNTRPRSNGFRKSLPIPNPQQQLQQKKPVMDDDRVRSLEEALSKIDCCDPHERSNFLPYRCSDGKWRMVKSKCVGGAWVVHVPGAVQPSVYLPLRRRGSQGTLDNWLKDQLISTRKPRSHSDTTEHHRRVTSQPQQRHYAAATNYSTMTTSGRFSVPHLQRPSVTVSSGEAIRNLLLNKSTI